MNCRLTMNNIYSLKIILTRKPKDGSEMKASIKDVIMCCVARATAHLKGGGDE
jgi:hypothetical protein